MTQETICKKLLIYGKVQGVFFRLETRKAAQNTGVSGYVRNLPDGSVEAVVQGLPEKVDQMLKWCRKGPPGARVDRVVTEKSSALPGCDHFDIRY